MMAKPPDHFHQVFDDKKGNAGLRQVLDRLQYDREFVVRKPGHQFVEQHQTRAQHEYAQEIEQFELPRW